MRRGGLGHVLVVGTHRRDALGGVVNPVGIREQISVDPGDLTLTVTKGSNVNGRFEKKFHYLL